MAWLGLCLVVFAIATGVLSTKVGPAENHHWSWSPITATSDTQDNTAIQWAIPTVWLSWRLTQWGDAMPMWVLLLIVLLFNAAVQSLLTMGLHCAELQVHLARDEVIWRTLQSRQGSMTNPLYISATQPLKVWQSLGLLLSKAVIHWLFGIAIQFEYTFGTSFQILQLAYLTILWAVFICFMISVSMHKPNGPLPATYGHLQTMADVIDEWSPKMYWG